MDENKNNEINKEPSVTENNAEINGEPKQEKSEVHMPVTARDAWRAKTRKKQNGNDTDQGMSGDNRYYYGTPKPSKNSRKKPLVIFGAIVAGIFLLALLCNITGIGLKSDSYYSSEAADINEKHIGVLYVEGTISESDTIYNHQYVIDTLNGMIGNDDNKGLMLYVNTPGGGVYESDEVYLKIKEYQNITKRPVYVYMASQATSGGYYISASADKIMANRNCWTGSIGVTMGTLFDISELLQKYGIKTETITSGPNKAMGSMTEPMTDEQRQIMQSMIDEAYEQFVGIVAEGRDLELDYVKTVADGRIYTAQQAEELDLVDQVVNTYDEATDMMIAECKLSSCEIYEFRYEEEPGLISSLLQGMDKIISAYVGKSDINALTELMQKDNELPLQYMCEVMK